MAERLVDSANRLRALGAETLKAGLSAPSYDGQFGAQVQTLGLEANGAIASKADHLEQLSENLRAIATAFSEADQESVSAFEVLGARLMDWIAQAGPMLSSLIQVGPSSTPTVRTTPGPAVTPAPVPTVPTVTLGTPVPTPVPDGYSEAQWQLALNARYGFCVHPLTDPDALSNHISTAQVTIVGPRFRDVPGPAAGPSWEGLTNNRFLLGLKAFSLLNQAFTSEANLSAWEQAEPNVQVNLHYARYEDGVRVAGVELRNYSESQLAVYRVNIQQFDVLADGTVYRSQEYQQKFQARDRYIASGGVQDFYFNQIENVFPSDSTLHIQLKITTVEFERTYRWPAWYLDATTGQAVPTEPRFYDSD